MKVNNDRNYRIEDWVSPRSFFMEIVKSAIFFALVPSRGTARFSFSLSGPRMKLQKNSNVYKKVDIEG